MFLKEKLGQDTAAADTIILLIISLKCCFNVKKLEKSSAESFTEDSTVIRDTAVHIKRCHL